jgi:RNase P protein component
MREIYRRSPSPAGPPSYLVWVARPSAAELDFDELRECMTTLILRAGFGN